MKDLVSTFSALLWIQPRASYTKKPTFKRPFRGQQNNSLGSALLCYVCDLGLSLAPTALEDGLVLQCLTFSLFGSHLLPEKVSLV